ncbi:MAG: HEPN domain-containing protein [Melioribacteraceae bacterium]|nr:HEPN domain-containing protein [Melioribacteraceae bacterium]MDD3558609.1 HEPN domain-containing protein [Melioribacteraceae bacterium]
MTKEEHINYWLESAEHDLETSDTLFEADKYDWSLFIGHLVLEKLLKAVFVKNNENKIPPKVHNLVRLAELSLIDIDDERKVLLDKINDFNVEARYPEYKNELYKTCTKEFAEENRNHIKELYQWLKSQLK